MKVKAMVLAAASVLGSAALAMAQEPPPNAPPPAAEPPAAQPPPPAVQPAPSPTPTPSMQMTLSTTGTGMGADKAPEEVVEEAETPLRWRGSTFTWNQAATTTLLGVGRDNIGGENEQYNWWFSFRPRYFLVDGPKDKLIASADISFITELTNSSLTTDKNETLFQDLALGLAYSRTLFESEGKNKGEYVTSASLSGRVWLPTSKVSILQGRYLSTFLGPSVSQQIKLLGKDATALKNVNLRLGTTWIHLFAKSYTPENGDLNLPRQNATGQTYVSDQLGGVALSMNSLLTSASADLAIVKGLTFSTEFGLFANFKPDFEAGGDEGDCDVLIPNEGCVAVEQDPNRTLYQPQTIFRLGLSYLIADVATAEIGYQNWTRWIGEDGQRRGIFYSPDAQFYLDLTANFDAIYTKIAKATKKQPAPRQMASR